MKNRDEDNGIFQWIKPEYTASRNIVLFGLLALSALLIAVIAGVFSTDGVTSWLVWAVIGFALLMYCVTLLRLLRSRSESTKQWNRLTVTQQKELTIQLNEEIIHYKHMVLTTDFICIYSKQIPCILFFDEIAWLYTFHGKLPNSATTYAPPEFKQSEGDNYLVLHDTKGGKYRSFTGSDTLPYYSYLVESSPQAVHGYSIEKKAAFEEQNNKRK